MGGIDVSETFLVSLKKKNLFYFNKQESKPLLNEVTQPLQLLVTMDTLVILVIL